MAKSDPRKDKDKDAAVEPELPSLPAGPPPKHVFRWDLDKTYLQTDFDTLKGLWKSAFEKPEEKKAIPGASALLRELRKVDGARVCFISGSPQQMRKVLTAKLKLDGIEFDDFVLKQNLKNLLRGRFRALREQVGYKLPALLQGRTACVPETRETCFGDDAEADAYIYSMYADLLAGNVGLKVLEDVLLRARAYPDDAARTLELAGRIGPPSPAVGRIFIHLDRHSATAKFDKYGRRLVPIYNYLQAGLVLLEDGLLGVEGAVAVVAEMMEKFEYTVLALRNSVEDLMRRGRVVKDTVRKFAAACAADVRLGALGARLKDIEIVGQLPAPVDRPIDYVAAFEEDARRRDEKKKDKKDEDAV